MTELIKKITVMHLVVEKDSINTLVLELNCKL